MHEFDFLYELSPIITVIIAIFVTLTALAMIAGGIILIIAGRRARSEKTVKFRAVFYILAVLILLISVFMSMFAVGIWNMIIKG